MLPTKFLYHYLFVLFLLIIFKCDCGSSAALAPALYVFGDSLFDSGNNNWLPTLAKVNYSPYGTNFPQGPTGRWTNGKIFVDFIADYLGLPYSPPYVDPSRIFRPKSLTGYSYASGACGILRRTGSEIGVCLYLEEQIRLFERTVSKHLSSQLRNRTQLSQHLAKSIYVFSMGSNDYLGNYFGGISNNRQRYNPQQFTQILIDTLSQNLQKLYELGARKVVVLGLAPLGCLESMVRQFKPKGRCAENVNQVVSNFNNQLSLMLKNLTHSLVDSHFITGHSYSLAYDVIINPGNYGLSDSKNPCCRTWENGTLPCILFVPPCSNPSKYFFWDGSHPTEAFTSLIAFRCIHDSSVCLPFNIHHLVQSVII